MLEGDGSNLAPPDIQDRALSLRREQFPGGVGSTAGTVKCPINSSSRPLPPADRQAQFAGPVAGRPEFRGRVVADAHRCDHHRRDDRCAQLRQVVRGVDPGRCPVQQVVVPESSAGPVRDLLHRGRRCPSRSNSTPVSNSPHGSRCVAATRFDSSTPKLGRSRSSPRSTRPCHRRTDASGPYLASEKRAEPPTFPYLSATGYPSTPAASPRLDEGGEPGQVPCVVPATDSLSQPSWATHIAPYSKAICARRATRRSGSRTGPSGVSGSRAAPESAPSTSTIPDQSSSQPTSSNG